MSCYFNLIRYKYCYNWSWLIISSLMLSIKSQSSAMKLTIISSNTNKTHLKYTTLVFRIYDIKGVKVSYLLLLLLLSSCRDPVGRHIRSGPSRPSLTGSCRFGEQACHVMEGCQDNVSRSCRLWP